MSQKFSTLSHLSTAELENLEQLGFTSMTAIQEQALPAAFAGKDVIAQAKTGSGKTAAFGIPLLHNLNPRFFGVQGLVLCPTRELASQVASELRKLARFQANIKIVVLCGGMGIGPQIASIEKGAHVVVGTPGRIKDHLRKNTLHIDQVQTLVLDEGDRMLDMGFRDDIVDIVEYTPKNRQTLIFSATFPTNIEQLSRDLQNQPLSIKVESTHQASTIQQQLIITEDNTKDAELINTIHHFKISHAVIFCNTKHSVNEVTALLQDQGYVALALHGDLEQRDRDEIYARFKNHSAHFLIATDVAARGLDVSDLPAVINYDLPHDPEVYVHRIGRTGRAGSNGIALSLANTKESFRIKAIEAQLHQDIAQLSASSLSKNALAIVAPPMVTLCLSAGRRDKIRPGDILGALTNNSGLEGQDIGKIDVLNTLTYVAVKREVARLALTHLARNKVKNKTVRARKV